MTTMKIEAIARGTMMKSLNLSSPSREVTSSLMTTDQDVRHHQFVLMRL